MKVLVLTHGTRGDVQPYAVLALALRHAGHEAVLDAPAASADLAEPYGIRFAPLDDGPNELIDDPEIREAIETNYRGIHGKRIALQVMRRSKPLYTTGICWRMSSSRKKYGPLRRLAWPNE